MGKTVISLIIAAIALAGCGGREQGREQGPPQGPDTHGEVVNGLRLSLSAERDTWERFEDVTLTVELENVTDEKRVVPGYFCGTVRWPAHVQLQVKTPSGQVFTFRVGSYADLAYVHPHGPLVLGCMSSVRESVNLAQLSHTYGASAAVGEAGGLTVWAELTPQPFGSEPSWAYGSDFPAQPTVPGQQELPMSRDDVREAFEQGWPSWAWRGKLTSNVLHLTVQE